MQLVFWVILIVWGIFIIWGGIRTDRDYYAIGGGLLSWILFLILGLKAFGFPN